MVSLDACDSFSLPFVVVSLSMPQIRGSCGHLKGSYDNHSSCLNCSGCFRSSCCSVCLSWPDLTWSLVEGRRRFSDRQMGRKKDAKVIVGLLNGFFKNKITSSFGRVNLVSN